MNSKLLDRITNVASVPQRSPFRYPGGKTWLIPIIRLWLSRSSERPSEFIEPFAGGASVGLAVAFENLANHVTLVELDEQVAAVWQTILSDTGPMLAEAVENFDLSAENITALLVKAHPTLCEKALQTIVQNRVNRGGILAPGAGRLKNGENGKGLRSRWYPTTLKRRILQIHAVKSRISFIHGDGLEVLRENQSSADSVYFIDPPYTAGGKRSGQRLYRYSHIDHEELFRLASTLRGDLLMSYDNASDVKDLATKYNFDTEPVAMKNTHHAKMTELLIGPCLDWLRV